MTIEVTRPEIEALIHKRLETGAFRDAEEVILDALRSSESKRALTGADLLSVLQASPYMDIDFEPSRGPLPVRDVQL
jgi:hypothetical protein